MCVGGAAEVLEVSVLFNKGNIYLLFFAPQIKS